jgi:hypothetical protein
MRGRNKSRESGVAPNSTFWPLVVFVPLIVSSFTTSLPAGVSGGKCEAYKSYNRVSSAELEHHVIERVEPRDPLIRNGVVHATVTVHVFVDESGRVVCAYSVGKNNPLLGNSSVDAALKWKFRPFGSVRVRRAVQGEVTFRIDR